MLLYVLVFNFESQAQTDADENLFLLIHPSFSEVYLNIKSIQNQNYLSLTEALNLFEMPFKILRDTNGRVSTIGSSHQDPPIWMLDLRSNEYLNYSTRKRVQAGDVLQVESMIYLKVELYDSIFKVKWTLNHSSMAIGFTSDVELPFQWRARRAYARGQLSTGAEPNTIQGLDLQVGRNRKWLGLGALDYRYTTDYTPTGRLLEGRLTGGIELFGGDISGSLSIQQTKQGVSVGRQLTNWRYVTSRGSSDRYALAPAQILIGKSTYSGISGALVKGIYISNAQIMPRKTMGDNILEGQTEPHSDVDLWFSGRLIDYTTADSLGRFVFRLPLNYGQSRVELKIYTPDGREIIEHRQLNIPFAFLPAGQINYQFQLGQSELSQTKWTSVGQVEAGIIPEMSARLGMHTNTDSMGYHFRPSGSLHARILQQYLLNVSLDGQGNSRMSLATIFSNRMSTTITYDNFKGINRSNSVQLSKERGEKIQIQHIMPLSFKQRPLGFRIDGELTSTLGAQKVVWSADALWNQGLFTNRLHFKAIGTQAKQGDLFRNKWQNNQEMTLQSVFLVPRWGFVPRFIQGLSFRGTLTTDFKKFSTQSSSGGQFRFSVAKNIGRSGRLQLNASRPIRGQGLLFGLNIQYDFRSWRTSTDWGTQWGSDGPEAYLRHAGMGSVMWDATSRKLMGSPAEQVGRSGLTVRFFMDENVNKKYDLGELIVPVPSARLDKSYSGLLGKDNLLRFLQLQSYWRYQLQIDENTLPEADLVALTDCYTFIACPNQTHRIDVPLYRAGSISGEVLQKISTQTRPLGGVRISISSILGHSKPYSTIIRSYADGSFFIDRLQPGTYCLKIDKQQLEYLGGSVDLDSMVLVISANIDGHHYENVKFIIYPELPTQKSIRTRPLFVTDYRLRLEQRARICVSAFVDAQQHFYGSEWLLALNTIDSSLGLFPTDYGLALKGSAHFMQGDTMLAYKFWTKASNQNPFIALPFLKGYSGISSADSHQTNESMSSPHDQLGPVHQAKMVELDSSRGWLKDQFDLRNSFQTRARIAVSSFVETQELLYQGCHREALDMLDLSLSLFASDHGLALRGTISFLMGQRFDAHKFWALSLQRNPSIQLSDPAFLNQLKISSGQTSQEP